MPILGEDPFGDPFREMLADWNAKGGKFYNPLPVE